LDVAGLTFVSRGLGFSVNDSDEVGSFWESLQHILYRQKEQFSDGVGYSWIDGLKDHAASHVFFLPTLVLSGFMLQRLIDDLAVYMFSLLKLPLKIILCSNYLETSFTLVFEL